MKDLNVAMIGLGRIGLEGGCHLANQGINVFGVDPDPEARKRAIETGLFKAVFERLDQLPSIIDRFIEATPEDAEIKRVVIETLGKKSDSALIYMTTSTFPCSMFASLVPDPSLLVNTHILPDLSVRRLVEIQGPGGYTDQSILELAKAEFKAIGFNVVTVKGESSGFIFNFIWHRVVATILDLLSQNGRTSMHEVIDASCINYFGKGCAPFMAIDLINIKTLFLVFKAISEKYGQPIPEVIVRMFYAGKWGLDKEEGFYEYAGTTMEDFHEVADMLKVQYGSEIDQRIVNTIWQSILDSAKMLITNGQDPEQVLIAIREGFPIRKPELLKEIVNLAI